MDETWICCSALAVDSATDEANCGSCGNACGEGATCVDGTCSVCPADQTDCNGVCKDLTSDSSNCGACGVACPADATCTEGNCVCFVGQTLCLGTCLNGLSWAECNGECVDLNSDPVNCGQCGIECDQASGAYCGEGACTCPGNTLTLCNNSCKDLQADSAHCGACGNACGEGETCSEGICVGICGEGETWCPISCCAAGEHCSSTGSNCCPEGFDDCGNGGCTTDLMSDNSHCGVCQNNCSDGQACLDGVCTTLKAFGEECSSDGECQPGLGCSDYWGTCTDGAIGNPCLSDGTCPNGLLCQTRGHWCSDGSLGSDCNIEEDCRNGLWCNSRNHCTDGAIGQECIFYEQGDCQDGLTCNDSICGVPLKANGEACGASSECEHNNCAPDNRCGGIGATCNMSSDCVTNNCANEVCALSEIGGSCVETSDCNTPTCSSPECQSGICVNTFSCEQYIGDAGGLGEACFVDSASCCMPMDNLYCQGGLGCSGGGTCLKLNDVTCGSDAECLSGLCIGYPERSCRVKGSTATGQPCTSHDECQAGICTDGLCGYHDGAEGCYENSHCQSGNCDGNHMCQPSCTPDCSGKNCGEDGCGGSCGDCSGEGHSCNNGRCYGQGGAGADCSSGADCQTSYCYGLHCWGGQAGAVCSSSSDCLSGSCNGSHLCEESALGGAVFRIPTVRSGGVSKCNAVRNLSSRVVLFMRIVSEDIVRRDPVPRPRTASIVLILMRGPFVFRVFAQMITNAVLISGGSVPRMQSAATATVIREHVRVSPSVREGSAGMTAAVEVAGVAVLKRFVMRWGNVFITRYDPGAQDMSPFGFCASCFLDVVMEF